jgi:hypothetical protein
MIRFKMIRLTLTTSALVDDSSGACAHAGSDIAIRKHKTERIDHPPVRRRIGCRRITAQDHVA